MIVHEETGRAADLHGLEERILALKTDGTVLERNGTDWESGDGVVARRRNIERVLNFLKRGSEKCADLFIGNYARQESIDLRLSRSKQRIHSTEVRQDGITRKSWMDFVATGRRQSGIAYVPPLSDRRAAP